MRPANITSSNHDMHAGELETSVLLAAYQTYVRDGWNTADHSAPDRRYLTTLASAPTTTPASLANHPRQQKKKDWVPLNHLGAAAGTLIGRLAPPHD